MSKAYNGHKNHSYWNQNLHLHSLENYVSVIRNYCQSFTREETAELILSEISSIDFGKGEGFTSDGVKWTKSGIRAALVGLPVKGEDL